MTEYEEMKRARLAQEKPGLVEEMIVEAFGFVWNYGIWIVILWYISNHFSCNMITYHP